MAKTASRPTSTYSTDGGDVGFPSKFGSGRWRNSNQISGTRFKICLCGKSNVGKTSILLSLQGSEFSDKPDSSISKFDYKDENDQSVEYSVWDPEYDDIDSLTLGDHYRNAHCLLLVYDITDFSSLEYLNYEIEKVDKNQYTPHAKFVLVQNKVDKKHSKHVPFIKQKNFIAESKLRTKVDLLVQLSAKTKEGIDEFFYTDLPELLQLPKSDQHTGFDSFMDSEDSPGGGKKRKKKKINCAPS